MGRQEEPEVTLLEDSLGCPVTEEGEEAELVEEEEEELQDPAMEEPLTREPAQTERT